MTAGYQIYERWAAHEYPFDAAACGFCITEHESRLTCTRADHAELRKAAEAAKVVRLLNKLRTMTYAPRAGEIQKEFIKLRKKYRKLWETR